MQTFFKTLDVVVNFYQTIHNIWEKLTNKPSFKIIKNQIIYNRKLRVRTWIMIDALIKIKKIIQFQIYTIFFTCTIFGIFFYLYSKVTVKIFTRAIHNIEEKLANKSSKLSNVK